MAEIEKTPETKLYVGGITARIYDAAVVDGKIQKTLMKRERTREIIDIMAEHMQKMSESCSSHPGSWDYIWPGVGTLSWRKEEKKAKKNGK